MLELKVEVEAGEVGFDAERLGRICLLYTSRCV